MPVTASFIIAAVVVAPALTGLGVAAPEAYMFVFYYAVLSEVSPPTALAAVAAAAITGGDAFRTMLMTWRYTLPAFLVPFAFVLTGNGGALLWQAPWQDVLLATAVSSWRSPRWPWRPAAGWSAGRGRRSGCCARSRPCSCSTSNRFPRWPGSACSAWRSSSTSRSGGPPHEENA